QHGELILGREYGHFSPSQTIAARLGCHPVSSAPAGGRVLASKGPVFTAELRWNRISNLESFGPKADTLLLGHRSSVILNNDL
ncbi:hypothetical protein AVEN_249036-1, partial [Araneus ventricosus]